MHCLSCSEYVIAVKCNLIMLDCHYWKNVNKNTFIRESDYEIKQQKGVE